MGISSACLTRRAFGHATHAVYLLHGRRRLHSAVAMQGRPLLEEGLPAKRLGADGATSADAAPDCRALASFHSLRFRGLEGCLALTWGHFTLI